MSEDAARLFLALWPDDASRQSLAAERDRWRWPPGARPVHDADLHLTLHYIGAFARAQVPALEHQLQRIAPPAAVLAARDREVWKGGIAVLRLDADAALLALHRRLAEVLVRFAVPLDDRPFSPHVTLARRARGAEPPSGVPALAWTADGFALVASAGGPAPSYRVLRSFGARAAA